MALTVVAVVAGHLTVGLAGQAATSLFTYSSTIGSLATGGNAVGELWLPVGVAAGPQDRVYVADTGNERIQIFNADGTFYAKFGGPGDPDRLDDAPMEMNYPSGIVVDQNGKILVVESDNHRMQLFAPNPSNGKDIQFVKSFGAYGNYDVVDEVNLDPSTGDYIGPAATLTGLNFPTRAAIRPGTRLNDPTDTAGRVALVDGGNHRVIVLDAMLRPLFAFGTYVGDGNAPGNMEVPWGIGMDLDHIYVTDWANHRTETFSPAGQILSGFGSVGITNSPGSTERPFDVQPDGQGHLIVADRNRSRVLFLTPDPLTTQPLCSDYPSQTRCSIVATDGVKYDALVIGGFTPDGQELGRFSHPQAVAMDSTGRLIVLDTEGHRVVVFRVAQISIPDVSVSAGPVQAGQTVTVSVTVANDGADPIMVAPLVTANLAGTLTTPAGVWLAASGTTTFTVPFVTNASGELCFTVKASGTPGVGDPIFSATATTEPVTVNSVPGPKLSIGITSPARVGLGSPILVQMSIMNTGTSAVTAVLPIVDVPPGTGVSLTSSPAVVAAPLQPGASRTYNFTYTATGIGTATFTGRATAYYANLLLPGGGGQVLPTGTLPTASVVIDSDVIAPTTSIVSISPSPSASGWYLGPVTVRLSAPDATAVRMIKYWVSGLVGFSGQTPGSTATINITQDGGNELMYFAEDMAHNVEAPNRIRFDIDSRPPTISRGGVTPSANAAGWINRYPTIKFVAADDGSGVTFITAPVTVATDKAGIVVKGTARDVAGHSSQTDVIVNVDTKAPALVCAPTVAPTGLNGWYTTGTASVTVRCDAIDQSTPNLLSGIAVVRAICPASPLGGIRTTTPALTGTSPQVGPTAASATCVVSGEGLHPVHAEARDVAGNLTVTQPIMIKVDRTAPVLSCSVSASPIVWPRDEDKMVAWKPVVTVTDRVSTATFKLVAYFSNRNDDDDDHHGGDNDHRHGDDDHHDRDDDRDMTGWSLYTPDTSGYVKAERGSKKHPRVYTVKYRATDAAGNIAHCQLSVTVPRSSDSHQQQNDDEGNHHSNICSDNRRHTNHKR